MKFDRSSFLSLSCMHRVWNVFFLFWWRHRHRATGCQRKYDMAMQGERMTVIITIAKLSERWGFFSFLRKRKNIETFSFLRVCVWVVVKLPCVTAVVFGTESAIPALKMCVCMLDKQLRKGCEHSGTKWTHHGVGGSTLLTKPTWLETSVSNS